MSKKSPSPAKAASTVAQKEKIESEIEKLHFNKAGDASSASENAKTVLDQIRIECGLKTLTIISGVRTADEQALAMYNNESNRKFHHDIATIVAPQGKLEPMTRSFFDEWAKKEENLSQRFNQNYSHPVGKTAKAMATEDLSQPIGDQNKTLAVKTMSAYMKRNGLNNVTNHAGSINLEVYDISDKNMTSKVRKQFISSVRRRIGHTIFRFGFPEATLTKHTFHDPVFHLEIMYEKNDGVISDIIHRTA